MSSNSTTYLDQNLARMLPKHLEAKDSKYQEGYESFKKEVTQKALKILTETIPQRIAHFSDCLPLQAEPGMTVNVDDFPSNSIYSIEEDATVPAGTSRKRAKIEGDGENVVYLQKALTNPSVVERIDTIKKDTAELLELVASVKLWIQLNIPKIEDGNNFGVAIQEEVIQELTRVEDAAFALRESTSKFYQQRAKLVTKVIKYPNVEDYRIALKELDEKQWFQMRVTQMDTRNNYAIIYDMLHKNWQKIIKPRNTDGSIMVC